MAALVVGLLLHIAASVLRADSGDGSALGWSSDAFALAGAVCTVVGLAALLRQTLDQ